jgi:hypothetical protein
MYGWSEFSDPSIWITESIYIQVGNDYISVIRDRPGDLTIYDSTLDIDDVMNKLRQAINEGK